MFPGVNGFEWTFGQVLFLGIFFAVLLTVGTTVLLAFLRSTFGMKPQRVASIRWKEDFHDLPSHDRSCRHELSGQVEQRTCANAFECGKCGDHVRLQQMEAARSSAIPGLSYPPDRYYHRGHTWVEPQQDGTVLVGLDDMAERLIGTPDSVELPAVGARLWSNGAGWMMRKRGYDVRVLAPVSGEVVETGSAESGFYLRVKPDSGKLDVRHLLHGAEVSGWIQRELERLQIAIAPAGAPSLADGGELMKDVISNAPAAAWDRVLGDVFLNP